MARCEFNERCAFFNNKLEGMPADADEIKKRFCLSNNLHCARWIVANTLGPAKMPASLFPIHKERAYEIIAQG
jgi:hypothetical protein